MTYSKESLENTIKVWQPYSKEPLTLEDAREITQNMVGFFECLIEADRAEKLKEAKALLSTSEPGQNNNPLEPHKL